MSFDQSPELIEKFQSQPSYNSLLKSVSIHGVMDPCLVQAYPDRLQMETGCQRLMIARQIGITDLVCFVYPWQGGLPQDHHIDLVPISSIKQLKPYFRNDSIASYQDIIAYLGTGRIQL